jgi:hypothetical protein
MKTKTKKVYYCDFCGKHKLTSNSIIIHEKHCTLNPNRICRVCKGKDENCPMCEFSKRRIIIKSGGKIDPLKPNFNLEEKLKEYWDKKQEEEILAEIY